MTGLDGFIDTFLNVEVALRYLPAIAQGAVVTIWLAVTVVITGTLAGALLATSRALAPRPVKWSIIICIDILRALPPLVVIIFLFFSLPYLGWSMSAFVATWLALSLILAAFSEEVFWSGILSVPRGQWEAARATGLSQARALLYVVFPQSLRLVTAPLTNRIVAITKSTALGSVVAMPEILAQATSAMSNAGNATPLVMAAIAYVAIFLPVIVIARRIETAYAWRTA